TTTVGSLRIHALEAGLQWLDGGAMFGVVPKPLWERRIPADERNRIPLALRCLLVEAPNALVLVDTGIGTKEDQKFHEDHGVPKPLWERRIPADERNRIPLALRCLLVEAPNALVLVDTGIGNKEDEKFHEIYGVRNEGDPTRLEDAIRHAGFAPEDVDIVLDTHLHFDHAGGNTLRDPAGRIRPAFPHARYVVQEAELEFAKSRNERIRASYLEHNHAPITEAGLWDLVRGE